MVRKTVTNTEDDASSVVNSKAIQGGIGRRTLRSNNAVVTKETALHAKTDAAELVKVVQKPTNRASISAGKPNATVLVVHFEACKSCHRFAKKARELFAEFGEQMPKDSPVQLELSINEDGTKVRRGAFEISVYEKQSGPDKRTELWSGLKRGPPRTDKYPESQAILSEILQMYD